MFDDYPVKPRSNEDVVGFAKQLRNYFGVQDQGLVDVIACAQRQKIWTIRGEKRLNLETWPDKKMGRSDAVTIYEGDRIIIAVRPSVRHDAFLGVGRARNTFAHEFGHAVMHEGAPKHRRADGNFTYKTIKPFESAEHHAKVFGPAFLINDSLAEKLSSAEEISVAFGISLESAGIYFDQLQEKRTVRNPPNASAGWPMNLKNLYSLRGTLFRS